MKKVQETLKEVENMGFHGEGYKKIDFRLKRKDFIVGKERLRRILAEEGLLCPQRESKPRGPQVHDGTIIPIFPNKIWGTDMTKGHTIEEGKAHVWALIDHFTGECLGIHASKSANRFEAMEPMKQAILEVFGKYEKDVANGILMRHDHGSQYTSKDFQKEVKFFGMTSSPSFVRTPEGNGVIERFFRTLKENCLWKETFKDIEQMNAKLQRFRKNYNNEWILERHRYKTPTQVRQIWNQKQENVAA